MNEKEKLVNEFMESLKIRLEQLLAQDNGLVKYTFWKNFGDKRIKIEMSIEGGKK